MHMLAGVIAGVILVGIGAFVAVGSSVLALTVMDHL